MHRRLRETLGQLLLEHLARATHQHRGVVGSAATNSSAPELLPMPSSPNSKTRWPRRYRPGHEPDRHDLGLAVDGGSRDPASVPVVPGGTTGRRGGSTLSSMRAGREESPMDRRTAGILTCLFGRFAGASES
jgi:hypothetical protein